MKWLVWKDVKDELTQDSVNRIKEVIRFLLLNLNFRMKQRGNSIILARIIFLPKVREVWGGL
jgi:hypothetical protein